MASLAPLFAILEYQADPVTWSDLPRLARMWLQDAGGFAALGLIIWLIHAFVNPLYVIDSTGVRRNRLLHPLMFIAGGIAFAFYMVTLIVPDQPPAGTNRSFFQTYFVSEYMLAVAGAFSLIAFCTPFLIDMSRTRFRRIYAIAKLSFKEAIRRRVVWVFLLMLLVFLFPATWFFRNKPEEELRNIISITYTLKNILLITVGLLLAGFSIPNDVKNQTIHTIITKPVERFEIVIGRFAGYMGLVTLALLAMVTASLLLIRTSNIDESAKEESMKARLPVYGKLEFRSRKQADFQGTDVGIEKRYRRFIAGHPQSSQRAIWNFMDVPSALGKMDVVPCEFGFDVYRTTKGDEGVGVGCSFNIITWKWDDSREQEYMDAFRKAFGGYPLNISPPNPNSKDPARDQKDKENWDKVSALAAEFGRFEWRNKPIHDNHTYAIPVPPGLFLNAKSGTPGRESPLQTYEGPARVQAQLKCETPSQFLGCATYDLYFLQSDGSFELNYFKGAIGTWYRLCIVIALAVACSTYLAGSISFLNALFLFMGGYFLEFIRTLAVGQNVGGGPLESLARLVRNENAATELDSTPTNQALLLGDSLFRWVLRRVQNVIPDVERFGWSDFVGKGFDITPNMILVNGLFFIAYVLPWAVMAYYLMRSREIAA